jgi:hypothetical protein
MVDTAIFLGAGASKAEGAPLQGELFKEYFSSSLYRGATRSLMNRELTEFFSEMFGIDVKRSDLTDDTFPTFEEVLGLTDLAVMRKEAFRHFDIENRAKNSGRLRFVAQYLVFLVAKVLDAKLRNKLKPSLKVPDKSATRGRVAPCRSWSLARVAAFRSFFQTATRPSYGL